MENDGTCGPVAFCIETISELPRIVPSPVHIFLIVRHGHRSPTIISEPGHNFPSIIISADEHALGIIDINMDLAVGYSIWRTDDPESSVDPVHHIIYMIPE